MKWFKHDTDAHSDAKLEKILMRYGADGYALYWYCIELIAGKVDAKNYTFELEHDAELLGYKLKVDSARVEEIMRYMVNIGLFEESSGVITCMKLAKRLDSSMTSNPEMRKIIRKSHDTVMTCHDGISTDKTIRDKTRLKEKRESKTSARGSRLSPDFEMPEEWATFAKEERPDLNPARVFSEFKDYWISKAGKDAVKIDWLAVWRNWVRREKSVVSHTKTVDNKKPDVWGVNVTKLMTMASQHNITPRPGEGWDDLRRRVENAIRG